MLYQNKAWAKNAVVQRAARGAGKRESKDRPKMLKFCRSQVSIWKRSRIGELTTVTLLPFALRKPQTFAERKATTVSAPIPRNAGLRVGTCHVGSEPI